MGHPQPGGQPGGARVGIERIGRVIIAKPAVREAIERGIAVDAARLGRVLSPVELIRPADLLVLRFSFVGLRRSGSGGRRILRRRAAGQPASLIVDLQPQHVIERAFFEGRGSAPSTDDFRLPDGSPVQPPPDPPLDPPPSPPVRALLSAHTRLVFDVGDAEIPFTAAGLLAACSTLPLRVVPHAAEPARRTIVLDDVIGASIASGALHTDHLATAVRRATAVNRTRAAAGLIAQQLGSDRALESVSGVDLAPALGISAAAKAISEALAAALRPLPRAAHATETSIELPWRLAISPGRHGGFAHSREPVEHDGRTELWHSRLGVRRESGGEVTVDERSASGRWIRAIWARDFDRFPFVAEPAAPTDFPDADGSDDDPPFVKSLNSRDRMMIVHETSNFRLSRGRDRWDPPTVDVDQLHLTALGGTLIGDLQAPQLPDGPFSLSRWQHRATLGRDHEVKVVYAGFLFPFGHRASLVKVTERKFTPSVSGNPAALYQRFFIVVRDRVRTYTADASVDDNRGYGPVVGAKRLTLTMPLASVNVLTEVTPPLDPMTNLAAGGFVFFPRVDGAPYQFRLSGVDRLGNPLTWTGPLMFVERDHNLLAGPGSLVDQAGGKSVVQIYWDAADSLRRQPMGGQRVAFAPDVAPDGSALDTVLSTDALYFDALIRPGAAAISQDEPRFTPTLRSAAVVVPSVSALAGASTPMSVGYPPQFASGGFANNKANVFLAVAGAPAVDFSSQGDRCGGFATPNVRITGLSGRTGPIGGDITKAINGTAGATDFFAGIQAKLFGIVPLVELLKAVGLGPEQFPRFVGQSLNRVTALMADLERIITLRDEIVSRFGAESDPAVTAVLTQLQSVADAAALVLQAITSFTPGGGLAGQISELAGKIGGLASSVDHADLLPAGIRSECAGVCRRVAEHVEDVGDVVGLVEMFAQGITLPPVVTARLGWSTQLGPWPEGAAVFQPRPIQGQGAAQARSTLDLVVEIQAPTRPGKQPTALVSCSITPFRLQLIGDDPFIALSIEKIEFLLAPGKKPDVNVVLDEDEAVTFGGPLSFVNTLRDIIPFDGFSDPPYLDVSTDGIKAGFDLAVPSLTVGVLSLCNISFGAELRVPFVDDALDFTFSFCTRERPFRLTVWLFGGGGFFSICVTPEKCRMLEAAFEFGAAVALDFGIASGSIEVMAGIYFRLEDDDSELTGYLRMRGEVDVLGLISACIELYLELSYQPASGKAVGRATLTIEVEVCFLSFSVSTSVEKKFKGSNQDPPFALIMGRSAAGGRPWDEYCAAFVS